MSRTWQIKSKLVSPVWKKTKILFWVPKVLPTSFSLRIVKARTDKNCSGDIVNLTVHFRSEGLIIVELIGVYYGLVVALLKDVFEVWPRHAAPPTLTLRGALLLGHQSINSPVIGGANTIHGLERGWVVPAGG